MDVDTQVGHLVVGSPSIVQDGEAQLVCLMGGGKGVSMTLTANIQPTLKSSLSSFLPASSGSIRFSLMVVEEMGSAFRLSSTW